MANKLRLALVGAGRIGSIHLSNIINNENAMCSHILSQIRDECEYLVNKYKLNDTKICMDNELEMILKNDKIDGVIIASSTKSHYNIIKSCLNYGKPIFVEKPFVERLTEIDELYSIANENNVDNIMIGLQRKYDDNFIKLKELIYDNEYLKEMNYDINSNDLISLNSKHGIEKIMSISRDPRYPAVEYINNNSNCFFDSIIHDVDIICHILNEYPTKIYSNASTFYKPFKNINDYDRVYVNLKFNSGVLGLIDWCRHSGFSYDQQLKVFGFNGSLSVENELNNTVIKQNNNGTILPQYKDYFLDRYRNAYKNEINTFISRILGNIHYDNSYDSVRNTQIILESAQESAIKDKVIDIDYKNYKTKLNTNQS